LPYTYPRRSTLLRLLLFLFTIHRRNFVVWLVKLKKRKKKKEKEIHSYYLGILDRLFTDFSITYIKHIEKFIEKCHNSILWPEIQHFFPVCKDERHTFSGGVSSSSSLSPSGWLSNIHRLSNRWPKRQWLSTQSTYRYWKLKNSKLTFHVKDFSYADLKKEYLNNVISLHKWSV